MSSSSGTEEWMPKKEFFSILQGYASTLEVQYMIDQALDKFISRGLESAVEGYVTNQLTRMGLAAAATTVTSATSTGSGTPSPGTARDASPICSMDEESAVALAAQPSASASPSAEWMETLLRAKVEADLEQQLPRLVEAEVAKQLKARAALDREEEATRRRRSGGTDRRQDDTLPSRPKSRSPPPGERPPLPPSASPPRKPAVAMEEEDDDDDATPSLGPHAAAAATQGTPSLPGTASTHASGSGGEDTTSTTTKTSGPNEAFKQRARILAAIQDVEHQVNGLQREVNELSHQGRTSHQRMGRLWSALSPETWRSAQPPLLLSARSTASDTSTATHRQQESELRSRPHTVATPCTTAATTTTTTTPTNASAPPSAAANIYGNFYAALVAALDGGEAETVRALVTEVIQCCASPPPASRHRPECSAVQDKRESSQLSWASLTDACRGPLMEHDASRHSPSALRQSPIVAAPTPELVNNSVNSSCDMSAAAFIAPTAAPQHPRPEPVLPLYTRHAAPPLRTMTRAPPDGGASPQLGVDAVDVPGGLLPSALGLRGGGVRVLSVAQGHVAECSGVRPGDVLLQVNHIPVETCAQLRTALRGVQKNDTVPVEIYRNEAHALITVTLRF